jgi:hypothetical protein
MSLWISSAIILLLVQSVQCQSQETKNGDSRPAAIEEVAAPSDDAPRRLDFERKDWNLTRAYFDVFAILSNQNACSSFYGGPRAATTVLNGLVRLVKSELLDREVSFQMGGRSRVISDSATGARYRLFDRAMVNSNGSFYQRRSDPLRKYPSDVGNFPAGSRPARALILLHELGHLMEGGNGTWLLPDDAHDGPQSRANTLRVQQACRVELEKLR